MLHNALTHCAAHLAHVFVTLHTQFLQVVQFAHRIVGFVAGRNLAQQQGNVHTRSHQNAVTLYVSPHHVGYAVLCNALRLVCAESWRTTGATLTHRHPDFVMMCFNLPLGCYAVRCDAIYLVSAESWRTSGAFPHRSSAFGMTCCVGPPLGPSWPVA